MVRKFKTSILAVLIAAIAVAGFSAPTSYKQGNVIVLKGNNASYSFNAGGTGRKVKKVRILGYGGAVNYVIHNVTQDLTNGTPVIDAYLSGASAGTTTTLQLDLSEDPSEGVILRGSGVSLTTNSGDTGSSSSVYLYLDKE